MGKLPLIFKIATRVAQLESILTNLFEVSLCCFVILSAPYFVLEIISPLQHPVSGVWIRASADSDTGLIMIYSISDAIISCFAPGDEELPSQRKLPPEKAGASQDTMSAQRSLFLR